MPSSYYQWRERRFPTRAEAETFRRALVDSGLAHSIGDQSIDGYTVWWIDNDPNYPADAAIDQPPPPPSGPSAVVPSKEANRYAAYLTWRGDPLGVELFIAMLEKVRQLAAGGDTRISVKAVVEWARRHYRAEINNTWTAWLADDFVATDPRLLPLIERRKRRKEKTP